MPITRQTDRVAIIAAWEQLPPDEAIAYTKDVLQGVCLAERLLALECDRHEADLERALVDAEYGCRNARLDLDRRQFLLSNLRTATAALERYDASLAAYSKVAALFATAGNVAGDDFPSDAR